MKKVLDRVWEWMKSTAWFQVVLLVGVVVAVVLCISPITSGISNAISDNKRAKYIENNKVNYDEVIAKIDDLDKGGDEFAVLFCNPTDSATTSLDEGLESYETEAGAVKVFCFNTQIVALEDGGSKSDFYDIDENYYNYYKVTNDMMTGFKNATQNIYESWKSYSTDSSGLEVTQNGEYTGTNTSSLLPSPTLVWFRTNDHIDSEFKNDDNTPATILNPVTGAQYNYHVSKVYATIEDSSDSSVTSDKGKTLAGLHKFFSSSDIDRNGL